MPVHASNSLPAEYEQLQIGVALYDPETAVVLDTNTRLESLFGYPTATLKRLSVDEYSANTYDSSGTRLRQRFRDAADGEPQTFRWRVKRADGTLVWVQVHLSAISVSGERRVLAEVRDVEAYTTANKRIALLSRIIRHNLRNDLTVIAGRAEQLGSDTAPKRRRTHTGKIKQKVSEIERMTESVRQIERATSPGHGHRERKRTATAAESVAETVRRRYPDATVTVVESTEMWFRVDRTFSQALCHAAENGIVHADRSDPTVTISVEESPNTGRVAIRIVDDCPPIPSVEIDALDAPGENESTAHGTGVGLFVMKWSIESLGGEITFERSTDSGNVVTFYLPPATPPESDG